MAQWLACSRCLRSNGYYLFIGHLFSGSGGRGVVGGRVPPFLLLNLCGPPLAHQFIAQLWSFLSVLHDVANELQILLPAMQCATRGGSSLPFSCGFAQPLGLTWTCLCAPVPCPCPFPSHLLDLSHHEGFFDPRLDVGHSSWPKILDLCKRKHSLLWQTKLSQRHWPWSWEHWSN